MATTSLISTPTKPFVTTAYRSDVFVDVSNDDFQDKWNTVFFYPASFTFVCPTELADLQGIYTELQSLDVEVYSVSRDSHLIHKTWHEISPEIGILEFVMLGDVNGVVTNNFDNVHPGSGLADRPAYLIDLDGIIQYIETTPGGVGRNTTGLPRRVKATQYACNHPDGVCPAKWEEGGETLAPSFDLIGKI